MVEPTQGVFNMRSRMHFFAAALVIAGIALFANSPINAQGLKGSQMPKKILGRLTYIKGNNDQERWKTFLDAQPKLIGMSLKEVEKRFGEEPICERDLSAVEYGLTQESVKSGVKENSWLHVHLFFRNGVVWKFSVEASNH